MLHHAILLSACLMVPCESGFLDWLECHRLTLRFALRLDGVLLMEAPFDLNMSVILSDQRLYYIRISTNYTLHFKIISATRLPHAALRLFVARSLWVAVSH